MPRGLDDLVAARDGQVVEVAVIRDQARHAIRPTRTTESTQLLGSSCRRGIHDWDRSPKAGNDHADRLLVEAGWNHRRPRASYAIQRRRRDQHPLAVERAIRAEQRLYKRWTRLRSRGKDERTIVVAIARELAGFVWATATDQPLQPAQTSRDTGSGQRRAALT
jgi:transposase